MSGRRVLYVDASAGASGDMILAALVDLGVPLSTIRKTLDRLPLKGWTISTRKVVRAGLAARTVNVRVDERAPERGWREIRKLVTAARLDPEVRDRALRIFRRLIEAEARAHGTSPEKVHLHEAGALDAIVDVVGACAGLARLGPDRIVVSPLLTGSGSVRCRHGLYPVPGPATTVLVEGVPVFGGEAEGERLTPTGAAILTTLADEWGAPPAFRPTGVGHGAGRHDFPDRPNVLRMVLGEAPRTTPIASDLDEEILVAECTLDDANPQVIAYAVEQLFHAGALEVFTTPVAMKKGRPGHRVSVLCRPEHLRTMVNTLLRETTTLGVRYRVERRVALARSVIRVKTRHGPIRVKVASMDGLPPKAWPEFEDCAAAARRRGVALREVQQAALDAYRSRRTKKTKEPR